MELKVGDIVEFKKYEDMAGGENIGISEEYFPSSGNVKEINVNDCDRYFCISESPYVFSKGSVARVISDIGDVNINSLNPGDEVLVKATVNSCYDDTVFINPVERFLNKDDVLKIVKHKEPEHFIVKEDYYGMYINGSEVLVVNKDDAKIYNSRNEANEAAAYMHLNAWKVIPYDD